MPDVRLHKALSHPVRIRAMQILGERVASPSDIARELELPVANVSYHVTTLLRLGFVEEVDSAYVRGAIEHFYRATRRPLIWSPEWAAWPPQLQDEWLRQFLDGMADELRRAVEAGDINTFDNRHTTLTNLRLDREGFDELMERMDDLLRWAIGPLQAEAHARLADGRPAIRTTLIECGYGGPED